ncbi:MAG: hypothetical protein ACYCT2_04370 [Thermoplasmataceae archaeon]
MNGYNPIQDHNDRVAHSDSRNDPPENNAPEFTQKDFYIPEPVKVKILCFREHDISDEACIVCGQKFAEMVTENIDLSNLREVGCFEESHEVRTPASYIDQRLARRYYEDTHYEFTLKGHICMDCWEDLPEGDQ